MVLADPFVDIHPRDVGHHEVGDDGVEGRTVVEKVERPPPAWRRDHVVQIPDRAPD